MLSPGWSPISVGRWSTIHQRAHVTRARSEPATTRNWTGFERRRARRREWIAGLEAVERERTGIRNLKVGYNRVFGYYLEVSHASTAMVPADYIRKQTLTGAERYLTPEMKEREAIVLNAQQDTLAREGEILKELSRMVAAAAPELLESATAAAELDALLSLAESAAELRWVRPKVFQRAQPVA